MLYAATDAADPDRRAASGLLAGWDGELVVSAFTATEADHLILSRLGLDAELDFLGDLGDAYRVDSLDERGLRAAEELCGRYRDLELGLADASMVVLADRWSSLDLATFDERHFRIVVSAGGEPFRLRPADSG